MLSHIVPSLVLTALASILHFRLGAVSAGLAIPLAIGLTSGMLGARLS